MISGDRIAEHRQRALSPDRPVLRGTAQNPDVFFQAREAVNPFYDALPEIVVGQYRVRYVVDRICEGALPVADPLRQCLVKQIPQLSSADFNKEKLDPPNAKQFRVTIRVTGPKGTQTWVQSMMTKG